MHPFGIRMGSDDALDDSAAPSGHLSGQLLGTGEQDQIRPNRRRRLESTFSSHSSITAPKTMTPSSPTLLEVGGESGEVAAQLTTLISRITELEAGVARLQSPSAAPSSPLTVPLAQSTDSSTDRPHPQPGAPPHHPAASPQQSAAAATSAANRQHDALARTPLGLPRSRQAATCGPFSLVPQLLTDKGGQGLYWARARVEEGLSLLSRVVQNGYAKRTTGNDIQGDDGEPIEYEPWELNNGTPTLAARRWREEHGPVVTGSKNVTPARRTLAPSTQPWPTQPSPAPCTALMTPEKATSETPKELASPEVLAHQAQVPRAPHQPAIWVNAVVSSPPRGNLGSSSPLAHLNETQEELGVV